jgi:hypothetical protein
MIFVLLDSKERDEIHEFSSKSALCFPHVYIAVRLGRLHINLTFS